MTTKLTAADGHEFECWLEVPPERTRGGLVILQEIFGVTDQLKSVARHYAERGYEVAIPALFDRIERGAVVPFSDTDRARALMGGLDVEKALLDVDATIGCLRAQGDKVAILGFCWGGGLALRAAETLDVDAAISFYGTQLGKYLDAPLKAPFQGHFGTKDDHVPAELLDEVKATFPEAEIFTYEGAGHAFANDARPSYVAEAAELAHARAEGFLRKHIH